MRNIPYNIFKTSDFDKWLEELPNPNRMIVKERLNKLKVGHLGDYKRFEGLIELRWKNGMRVYAFIFQRNVFVVLIGGNKNGQSKDIKKAKKIKEAILKGTHPLH